MKRSSFASLALVLSVCPSVAFATTSNADRAFVANVSQGGMFEVALGRVAAAKGSTQDIRDQGATEVHDHALVGAKLTSAASAAGIPFPTGLNAMFRQKLGGLDALSGRAFDDAYLRAMDAIHAKDGAAFAQEATSGSDAGLRTFASETHRIVLRHIGELRAIGPGM